MNKLGSILSALVLGATLIGATTACSPPCESLGQPSQQDREAAANGYEVEREDDMGNECELSEDGQWEQED